MQARHLLHLLAIASFASASVCAAPSSSNSGRSFGGGNSVNRGVSSDASTRSSTSSYRPSSTPSQRFINQQNLAGSQQVRRSLLSQTGPQPSPQVSEIIRERESSGPGWLGTAFLISLLSRHDLSDSDRSWINSRIDSVRNEQPDEAPALLPAVKPKVQFTFEGLDAPHPIGMPAKVTVSATLNGQPVPVSCEHPAAMNQNGHTVIAWTPEAHGVTLLTCKAGAHQERRLLRSGTQGV